MTHSSRASCLASVILAFSCVREQITPMEREMEGLQQDVKSVESRYGDDVLHLVIAAAYLAKLIGNAVINRDVEQYHPELLTELSSIIAAASNDQVDAS